MQLVSLLEKGRLEIARQCVGGRRVVSYDQILLSPLCRLGSAVGVVLVFVS